MTTEKEIQYLLENFDFSELKKAKFLKYGILPNGKKNLKPKFIKPKNKRR